MRIVFAGFLIIVLATYALPQDDQGSGASPERQPPASAIGPDLSGLLRPSIRASELGTFNGGNNYASSSFSGDLTYNHISSSREFTMKYSGGAIINTSNHSDDSNYQALDIQQRFSAKRWTFGLGDSLSDLPQSPVGSGAGIPGVGDYSPALGMGGTFDPNLLPNDSILTFDSPRISNSAVGDISYNFTRFTSITGAFSYGILRYLDYDALSTHQIVVTTGINHEVRRSSFDLKYTYMHLDYDVAGAGFDTQAAELGYKRQINQSLKVELLFGPELVHAYGLPYPNSIVAAGSASVNYARNRNSATLNYIRGVNGGSGLLQGAKTDSAQFSGGHTYRHWNLTGIASYSSSSGLTQNYKAISRTVGSQVSHPITRTSSAYFSYTYMAQSAGTLCNANICAFDGGEHVFGLGLEWHPRGVQLGR